MKKFMLAVCLIVLLVIHSSCTNEPKAELDYDETKQMMIDILQTEEGKKALLEIISDDKLKQHLVIDTDVVKTTIANSLLSKEGKDMWKQLFADPKFVASFHTSIAEEQEKMFKNLMKDATFQKQMMELLQNPEMKEETIKLLKSQPFRQHLEELIMETIDNPVYRAKLQKELNEKESDKKNKEKKNENNGEEDEENEA